MNLKNRIHNAMYRLITPKMLYGYKNNGRYLAKTRISNSTFIDHPSNLLIGDNVHIGHHNFIEASHGITIDEGCQITNFISMTTHSSHISIRLYGRKFPYEKQHAGYITGAIHIGAYSFIGPYSLIMPGTIIGKGCLIHAYSYVKGEFPEFSIIQGNPAKVVGDTRKIDAPYLEQNPELKTWYNEWAKESK